MGLRPLLSLKPLKSLPFMKFHEHCNKNFMKVQEVFFILTETSGKCYDKTDISKREVFR
jgi:hypothetical protein